MNDFIAIDVETANPDYSTICQIGIIKFRDGKIVDKWETLINPEDYFDGFNISIHGIEEEDVEDSPTIPEVYNILKELLSGEICLSHGSFDETALTRVFDKYCLEQINIKWLNNFRVVRRTWEQFSHDGYGLKNVANFLGFEFSHHNALEDARIAGLIFMEAVKKTGLNVDDWIKRVKKPIKDIKELINNKEIEQNPEGELFGEIILFTGTLEIVRSEAQILAAQEGAEIGNSVTKKTTMLVIGEVDKTKLAEGANKTGKMKKAQELISNGQHIKVITEADFFSLIQHEE